MGDFYHHKAYTSAKESLGVVHIVQIECGGMQKLQGI